MGIRETCWVIYLAGLPFSNFLNKSLDLWHGHATWAELWLPVLVGLTFAFPTPARRANRAFGVWVAVAGLLTLGWWYVIAGQTKTYPVALLMPLLHLVSILIFVWAAWQSWTAKAIPHFLQWIGRVGMVSILYGLIQVVSLDQFFKPISTEIKRDLLVGTIGNYNHFAVYLAMLIPIFLWWTTRWKYLWIGLAIGLVYLTSSEAGFLSLGVVSLWESWFRNRKIFYGLLVLGALLAIWRWQQNDLLYSLSSRLKAWSVYGQMLKERFITGHGAGFIFEYAKTIDLTHDSHNPLWHWRHAHNEYLQLLVEQGVLGLLAFGWLLVDAGKAVWRMRQNVEVRCCAGILLALLANALFNFPFHLWMLSSLGLMAYCGIKVIEAESCPS